MLHYFPNYPQNGDLVNIHRILSMQVIPPSSGLIDHAVSMRPDYHRAIVDTIIHYGWKEVIYIYDSHDGECVFDLFVLFFFLQFHAVSRI